VRFFLSEGRLIKTGGALRRRIRFWIPAFAGMTRQKQPLSALKRKMR
jgi:hypothetical protein